MIRFLSFPLKQMPKEITISEVSLESFGKMEKEKKSWKQGVA